MELPRRAQDIRKQLIGIIDRYKLLLTSAGQDWDRVRHAIVSGYFANAAQKGVHDDYNSMVEGNSVHIHPSSAHKGIHAPGPCYRSTLASSLRTSILQTCKARVWFTGKAPGGN
mmetsp:Transcript_9198/g.37752  ORF Transcript_9198/g.37752 Transcript_9198/m.37752 type:complete len:114 (+) Transcript_9198:1432-1773(+)